MTFNMKLAIAEFPVIGHFPTHTAAPAPARRPAKRIAKSAGLSHAKKVAYTCQAIAGAVSLTAMYCLVSHGQIFKSYLQW